MMRNQTTMHLFMLLTYMVTTNAYKVTACIDCVRNSRGKFGLGCSIIVLVRVIFLIVALINNVKVDKLSFPCTKNRKITYKIN